jgi:hypothetical protein
MAYYEEVFVASGFVEELLEVLLGGLGGEGVGEQDLGLVAGFGADEGGCLEAALEGARDDEIELYVQCIQHMREVEAVAFTVFVEGAFEIEEGIFSADACAGVAENEEIHKAWFYCRTGAFSVIFVGQGAVKFLQDVDIAWLVLWLAGFVVEDAGVGLVEVGGGGFGVGDGVGG